MTALRLSCWAAWCAWMCTLGFRPFAEPIGVIWLALMILRLLPRISQGPRVFL